MEAATGSERRGYGTFGGVFVPTLLTILGVIMYLRTGWVVGNAGILGGLAIIVAAFVISGFTGLALASIVTNIRIGAGGAYSIISKSLGLEVGGAIGLPLFLSQTLAVTLYVFGFRAGWLDIFPDHPAIVVDLAIFAAVFGIAYTSAAFAFRVQYVILGIVAISLIAIAVAAFTGSMTERPQLFGDYPGAPEDGFPGTSVVAVFAVFFPAATGILAGANISGELRDPRRSIPVGTMSAIAISFVVYVLLAIWISASATTKELVSDYTIMVEKSAFGPAVLAGLLAATFSSALASTVGAPRILQAIAQHGGIPRGEVFARTTLKGEPRNAMYLTGVLVLAALMLRDLNAVAPLITLFFLITYLMINVVVLIEQRLGLVSFRPVFKIPTAVPLIGAIGCLGAMFAINPGLGVLAIFAVLGFYAFLVRRQLEAPFGDVRSGLFVAMAEWAAKHVQTMEGGDERAWKPNLLVPVSAATELRGDFRLLHGISAPQGSIKAIGLAGGAGDESQLSERLSELSHEFREEGVFGSWTVVEADGLGPGLVASMQALRGAFFRPNTVFLNLVADESGREEATGSAAEIAEQAEEEAAERGERLGGEALKRRREGAVRDTLAKAYENGLGALLYVPHPRAGLGRRKVVTVLMDERSPDWILGADLGDLDLAVLVAYKLARNWGGDLNLACVVADSDQTEPARTYLNQLSRIARLPANTKVIVEEGSFADAAERLPRSDMTVLALPEEVDFSEISEIVEVARSSCMFCRDSGDENALA